MREKRTCTVPKHIVNGCNTKGNTEKRKKKKLKQNELNEMLNKAGKLRLKQCENKFRYQKLLNCLAHAKCLLMSCMFTDNLIYRYCHAMHPHTHTPCGGSYLNQTDASPCLSPQTVDF